MHPPVKKKVNKNTIFIYKIDIKAEYSLFFRTMLKKIKIRNYRKLTETGNDELIRSCGPKGVRLIKNTFIRKFEIFIKYLADLNSMEK